MPIPSAITDLSATIGSNSPSGADTPTDGDNFLRAHAAFIRQMYDGLTASGYATLAGLADTTDVAKGDAFVGVKKTASGSVGTTQHAVNEREVDLFDFMSAADITAAKAGVTPPDVTTALNNAKTALLGGGVLNIPQGIRVKVTAAIALHSGLVIRGGSNVDPYYGTKTGNEKPTFIYQETAALPVFSVGSGVCDVTIENLSISSLQSPVAYTAPIAGKYGIKFEGTRPLSSYRFTLRNITFYNFERAISVVGVDTGAGVDWQIDDVLVERCAFWNNTYGCYFNTQNADAWKWQNCTWTVWTNGRAIYCERSGYMEMDSCYAIPAETSASVFATGNGFVQLSDFPDNFRMVNCQAESLTYFLQVDASTGFENVYNQIQLIGCIVECPSVIQRQCKVVSVSSRYTYDVDCTGDDIEVHSFADSWFPTTTKFDMTGLRPRLFVSPGSSQTSGTVAGVATAVATTVFSLPASQGMYEVYCYLANAGALYTSTARLACDGTTLVRMGGENGANLTITVSGRNVQVTQISGVSQTVSYRYLRVA